MGDYISPHKWLYYAQLIHLTALEIKRNEGRLDMNKDQNDQPTIYQIKMQGRLDESWSGWFNGMAITFGGDATTLTGSVADQSALRGILTKLWDLNLALISVNRVEMDSKDKCGGRQ